MRLGELTLVGKSWWAGEGVKRGRGELGRCGIGGVGRWFMGALIIIRPEEMWAALDLGWTRWGRCGDSG